MNASYKYTAIIVEDNKLQFDFYRKELNKFDIIKILNEKLISFKNDIIREIESNNPDIIIMDVELSDCNAFEIVKEVKADRNNPRYFILMTNYKKAYSDQFLNTLNFEEDSKVLKFIDKRGFYGDDIETFDEGNDVVVDLKTIIENARVRITDSLQRYLQLKANSKFKEFENFHVKFIDIIKLVYQNKIIVIYYLENGKTQQKAVINEKNQLENELMSNKFFIKINRSLIVNSYHKIYIKTESPSVGANYNVNKIKTLACDEYSIVTNTFREAFLGKLKK